MARMRYVKPEFWTDSAMVDLSRDARLFYIGTWNFAICDSGHLHDDPRGLKLKIFPGDDVDVTALLQELVSAGRIVRRTQPDGKTYLHITRLANHQKVDSRWAGRCPYCNLEAALPKSKELPEPPPTPAELPETQQSLAEPSETPRVSSLLLPIPSTPNGVSVIGRDSPRPRAPASDPDFARFWAAYPNRKGKRAAEKAWPAAVKRAGSADVLIDAALRFAESRRGQDQRFTAHPTTWLNQDRYLDEVATSTTNEESPWNN